MFRDRHDAGRQLAQVLTGYRDARETIVLALPRGGVVVAYEISLALHLPLDVLVTRKLGTPENPELAMGALAETGFRYLNPDVIQTYRVSSRQLEEEVARQQREIIRRIDRYRGGKPLLPLAGKTVMLVDDGIATGATFFASLAAIRTMDVGHLVAAVPVAPAHVLDNLKPVVDEVVILQTPSWFFGISQFYQAFPQVEDPEVVGLLEKAQGALTRSEHGDK